MGLLMSDMLLIDPVLQDTVRLQDNLVEYVYATDLVREYKSTRPQIGPGGPDAWPLLLNWSQHEMAQV